MNIAFLTTRMDKPSYRFRVGQFIPFLERNGAACSTFVIPRPGPARWRLLLGLRRHDAVFLQKITEAYAAVFKWIDHNGYVTAEPPRESYIDGIWNKESDEDWLTELQVPVIPKSAVPDGA